MTKLRKLLVLLLLTHALKGQGLPKVGKLCGSDHITGVGFKKAQIDKILDAHNHFRAQTAQKFKAGNMRKMTWNENLANVAQKWADQCHFEHDEGSAR